MKLRLARKPRISIEDIEREAAAEMDRRISMGKPPPEEWKGVPELDAGLFRRQTVPPPPAPATEVGAKPPAAKAAAPAVKATRRPAAKVAKAPARAPKAASTKPVSTRAVSKAPAKAARAKATKATVRRPT